jgi:hypothetical protein
VIIKSCRRSGQEVLVLFIKSSGKVSNIPCYLFAGDDLNFVLKQIEVNDESK